MTTSVLGTATAPGYDRITDLAIGTDTITHTTAFSAAAGTITNQGTASALTAAGISAVLSSSAFTANTAAAFSLGTGATQRTFLALNDATAGYQAGSDGLIEITGYTGNLNDLAIL
ncbi:MAG: bluetail domain-containing putative surface protein [Prochlorococcaceae cyanobacterium]